MLIETLALAAAVTATSDASHLPAFGTRLQVATATAYSDRVADSGHRTGYSGRLFFTRPIMGGLENYDTSSNESQDYGAIDRGQTVYVRIGHQSIPISAWTRWNDESFPRFESARQEWLKEHGYVGGVRTFMNDANFDFTATQVLIAGNQPAATPEGGIQPRGILELSPEMTRFRSRMHVDAARAIERAGGTASLVTKVVAPAQVAAK